MRGRSFRGPLAFALLAAQKGVARKASKPCAVLPCCAGFVVPAQQGKAAAMRNTIAGLCGGWKRQRRPVRLAFDAMGKARVPRL